MFFVRCTFTKMQVLKPLVVLHMATQLDGGGGVPDRSHLYITWRCTVHHIAMYCISQIDVLTNTCVNCWTLRDYVLNIAC